MEKKDQLDFSLWKKLDDKEYLTSLKWKIIQEMSRLGIFKNKQINNK